MGCICSSCIGPPDTSSDPSQRNDNTNIETNDQLQVSTDSLAMHKNVSARVAVPESDGSHLSKLLFGRRSVKTAVKIGASDGLSQRLNVQVFNTVTKRRTSQVENNSRHLPLIECANNDIANLRVPIKPAICCKRKSAEHSNSIKTFKLWTTETSYLPHSIASMGVRDHQATSLVTDVTRVDQLATSEDQNMTREAEAQANVNEQPQKPESGYIGLFTSVQQLCYETIQMNLLNQTPKTNGQDGRLICLFIFGIQGSSKGELAYELVEHSELATSHLNDDNNNTNDCPLYCYIDVTNLIAANIDDRIRDYNQLVVETLRQRRREMALSSGSDGVSVHETVNLEYDYQSIDKVEDDQEETDDNSSGKLDFNQRNSSISSQVLAPTDGRSMPNADNSFSPLAISTKQRSILQLKLMKYYNSISTRWVKDLIHKEIERIEERLKTSPAAQGRNRVYLINLVPNQLSLFKSCLYLKQKLLLKEFKYHFWAVKFEKSTNIKLIGKERISGNDKKQQIVSLGNGDSHISNLSRIPLRFAQFRVPKVGLNEPEKGHNSSQTNKSETLNQAANILADGVNEKLGPKLTNSFVEQFESVNKLIRLRYNPMTNYSYYQMGRNDVDSRGPCSKSWSKRDIHSGISGNKLLSASMQDITRPIITTAESDQKQPQATGHSISDCRNNLIIPNNNQQEAPSPISSFLSVSESSLRSDSNAPPASTSKQKSIKSVVELHLIDSHIMNRSKCRETLQLDEAIDNVLLATYEHPREVERSASRSPLMFASQRHSSNYLLTKIMVAYPNGQSQSLFEVRHEHHKSVKIKSLSDVEKLIRVVARARQKLADDCDSWLISAIDDRHQKLDNSTGDTTNGVGRHRSASLSTRSNICHPATFLHGQIPFPSLIVYTIKVDIIFISTGKFKFPRSYDEFGQVKQPSSPKRVNTPIRSKEVLTPIIYLSPRNRDNRDTRPRSAHLLVEADPAVEKLKRSNSSCLTTESMESNFRPKRRVQFKLEYEPKLGSIYNYNDNKLGTSQRRRWIRDDLFVSSSDISTNEFLDFVTDLISSCSPKGTNETRNNP